MSVPLRRRWVKLRRHRSSALLPVIVLSGLLCVVLWQGVENYLYPVIKTMAASNAINRMSQSVSSAVAKCVSARNLSYQDFVTQEKDSNGQITALIGSPSTVNFLRQDLIEYLTSEMDILKAEEFGVPIGTLTGWMIFSGKGPVVRVELLSMGDVSVEIRHEFSEAGINQTVHQIYLDVSAEVFLMIPGEILPVSTENSFCVAETVIVGQIPDTYLYIGNGAE